MSDHPPPIAKLTPPRLGPLVERERLFRRLDEARERPLVWLHGPPGAGKSVLVASYLAARGETPLWYQVDEGDDDIATFFYFLGQAVPLAPLPPFRREYVVGLSTFARRWFERFYARLAPPFVVVLDDFQEASAAGRLPEVVCEAVTALPPGGNLIVVSREPPPPPFARARVGGRMAEMGWEAVRFTPEESGALARLRLGHRLSPTEVEALYARTEGWVAGIVLLTEGGAEGGRDQGPEATPAALFDYLAGEVFDRQARSVQEFLLAIALLPWVTPPLAAQLTGRDDASQLLATLARRNDFVDLRPQPGPAYRLHPLFREFLLRRGETSQPPEVRSQLQERAATLLAGAGEVEAAVPLYRAAGAWNLLVETLCGAAPRLLEEGREETLAGWIAGLPEGMVEAVPWLALWDGACRVAVDPGSAEARFRLAAKGFEAEGEGAGLALACAGVIEALFQAGRELALLDPWIDRLAALMAPGPELPPEILGRVVLAMVLALSLRRSDHPELATWVECGHALVRQAGDAAARVEAAVFLVLLHLWRGEMAEAEAVADVARVVAEAPETPPLAQVEWKALEGALLWYQGQGEAACAALEEGMRLAEDAGIHHWDFTLIDGLVVEALSAGAVERAAEWLEAMAAVVDATGRRFDQAFYYSDLAWAALLRGEATEAVQRGEVSVVLADEVGGPFLQGLNRYVLSRALVACGRYGEAAERLAEVATIGERTGSHLFAYMVAIARAQMGFARGRRSDAARHLAEGLRLGRDHGLTHFIGWDPAAMADLCVHALEEGIESEWAVHLVRRCRLVPPEPPRHLEAWPWPVRIEALGGWSVQRDGAPIRFSAKAQRRPMELLRALLALGASGVAEVQLTDLLWPEADGDRAHTTFTTTLGRLRTLLGCDDALTLRDGRLTLEPGRCWVDLWAFESLLDRARTAADARLRAERVEEALVRYRGPFLAGEEAAWVLPERARLRDRMVEAVAAAGRELEAAQSWEEAAALYRRGLEAEDTAEPLYQGLLRCHLHAGSHAEGVRLYERCRDTLTARLGVTPSPETEALYRALRG